MTAQQLEQNSSSYAELQQALEACGSGPAFVALPVYSSCVKWRRAFLCHIQGYLGQAPLLLDIPGEHLPSLSCQKLCHADEKHFDSFEL